MADVEKNLAVWESWDWSREGEEWSASWGGTAALWHGTLLPRINRFVPTGTILEIAPGYGRWTQYLQGLCDRLEIVDLTKGCIDHCRKRFAGLEHISYHVNDGRSLAMIEDNSIDFVFSFDSLVHVEIDVLEAYLAQLGTKLRSGGAGFIHHSNAGSYRFFNSMARRVPAKLRRRFVDRGLVTDVFAWRAESVTTQRFADACASAGLSLLGQETINWEHGRFTIDALSTFGRAELRSGRDPDTIQNSNFRAEAQRYARLYGAGASVASPNRVEAG
jgi:methyltransferase family protein